MAKKVKVLADRLENIYTAKRMPRIIDVEELVGELDETLIDVLDEMDEAINDIRSAHENFSQNVGTWADTDNEREQRADARESMLSDAEELVDNMRILADLLDRYHTLAYDPIKLVNANVRSDD